jgi:hypothetical protein
LKILKQLRSSPNPRTQNNFSLAPAFQKRLHFRFPRTPPACRQARTLKDYLLTTYHQGCILLSGSRTPPANGSRRHVLLYWLISALIALTSNSSKLTARKPGDTGKKRAILPRGMPQRVFTASSTSWVDEGGGKVYDFPVRCCGQLARDCYYRPNIKNLYGIAGFVNNFV